MENEDRMIFLNEPEKVDGLYPRDKTMEYKLKLEFEKAAKTGHPKIVSFNEAREANILSNTNFYHLENIFYVSLKNIYSINFFNIFDSRLIIENNLVQNILADQSSYEKLVTTINYYAGINTVYLVITNILIITFCYLFTKISLNIYKTK